MRHAFALIYVLVITVIIMITITSILTLGLSDIRQKNKVLATTGAWQMAQSGLEDGIVNYQKSGLKDCVPKNYNLSPTSNNYTVALDVLDAQGAYEFQVCSAVSGNPLYVSAIGYFKGSKLKMKADKGGTDSKWNIYQVGF